MGRKHWHPKQCRVCDRRQEDGHHISQKGYCAEHGDALLLANRRDLRAHRGPYFDHWRRRTLAAFGVVLDTDE